MSVPINILRLTLSVKSEKWSEIVLTPNFFKAATSCMY